jgi:hypothetical protein
MTEICVTFDGNETNYNYTLPDWTNYTHDKDTRPFNVTNTTPDQREKFAEECHNSIDPSISPERFATRWILYNWTDSSLNQEWWSHFKLDPVTSQIGYWEDWGFSPSNKANFSCDTKNQVYQVRLITSIIHNRDLRV